MLDVPEGLKEDINIEIDWSEKEKVNENEVTTDLKESIKKILNKFGRNKVNLCSEPAQEILTAEIMEEIEKFNN